MQYPTLSELYTTRDTVDVFKGYNHNLRIGTGEFHDMKNLTSSHYPLLSPRGKRGTYAVPTNTCTGLIAKDTLCYVDGDKLIMDGYPVTDFTLSTEEDMCPKQLISMGAYIIVMPDKKYINTMDTTDKGNIEAFFTTVSDVTFELSKADGEGYANTIVSPTEPENPNNLDIWLDTSVTPNVLKQFSESSGMWVSIATTYIKISSPGIGAAFKQYDGVTISGITSPVLQDLNNTMVLQACGDDYIIVVGILDALITQTAEDGAITVKRQMPNLDYVIESGNRLWGCRYGTSVDGKVVNEIYASKLGDFKNWNCFMGLSTDSYTASCGTDGQFTGAITHLGYPLFFKETCMHKVYGDYPANFQIQAITCRGVERGSQNSLAIVNETLYYKGRNGICAYDGSLPAEVSYQFGDAAYSEAVAGAHGNKYYVSMKGTDGLWNLFVYDAAYGMWHKEDNTHADAFCSCRNEMYYIDHDSGKIRTVFGSGTQDESPVEWMAETGVIGMEYPDRKYISRIVIRMSLVVGTVVKFYAEYDSSGEWEQVFTMQGKVLRSFAIPIRPKRCDHFRLRITGEGEAKVYSITKTLETGSDYN